MCLICLLHLQVMFNFEMDLSSYISYLHLMEFLLFIAAIITYGICLSYMLVLFGIRIFNLFKYEGNMSLISLILQQFWPSACPHRRRPSRNNGSRSRVGIFRLLVLSWFVTLSDFSNWIFLSDIKIRVEDDWPTCRTADPSERRLLWDNDSNQSYQ